MNKALGIIYIILLTTISSYAQTNLYVGIGMNSYNGDLSSYEGYRGSFEAGAQFHKKEKLNGSLNLGIGSVSGENYQFNADNSIVNARPNRYFKSNFITFTYELHYNLIYKTDYTIYIGQGIGLIRFTPKDSEGNDLSDIENSRQEDETYSNSTLMLPTSVGGIYRLPNKMGVGLQASIKNPLTDYLDNISELGDIGNDNILSFRIAIYAPLP